jgi:aryl-alcohol dehydrogenase
MQITAAVTQEKSAPFTLQTLELDGPRPDEVLVRVVGAGICHTDLSVRDQDFPPILPAVLGHEGAGVVEQVGARVTKVRPGDPVVMTFASCGDCLRCHRGEPAYCASFFALNFSGRRADGSSSFRRDGSVEGGDGRLIGGHFFGQSSFATYALAGERNVVKVPGGVPLESLGPLGCGVQTGAGAVMNSLRVPAGATIAVFGVGAVGMSAVMAARAVGCTTIIAVDINAERLALSRELGATHVIQAAPGAEGEQVKAIQEMTRGGADYSLEATGNPSVFRQAVDALGNRGVCGLIGAAPYGTEVSFDMNSIVIGRTIRGIIEGDSVPDVFIPALIELHRQGRFPFDRLIRYYPFQDINQAAEDAHRGATIKPVLRMP